MAFECPLSSLSIDSKLSSLTILLVLLLSSLTFTPTDAHDPAGNITIKWDVINWTSDGYVAMVNMYNFQGHRDIRAPGWTLGWTWTTKQVIWAMTGAQTTWKGNCSMFIGNIPHSCKKTPEVVDLLPGTPYNQQVKNCCKAGVLNSGKTSSFQIVVGGDGTTRETIKLPKNFTLKAPGQGYTCGPAKFVSPTMFVSPDKRRVTRALVTWKVTCKYSRKP